MMPATTWAHRETNAPPLRLMMMITSASAMRLPLSPRWCGPEHNTLDDPGHGPPVGLTFPANRCISCLCHDCPTTTVGGGRDDDDGGRRGCGDRHAHRHRSRARVPGSAHAPRRLARGHAARRRARRRPALGGAAGRLVAPRRHPGLRRGGRERACPRRSARCAGPRCRRSGGWWTPRSRPSVVGGAVLAPATAGAARRRSAADHVRARRSRRRPGVAPARDHGRPEPSCGPADRADPADHADLPARADRPRRRPPLTATGRHGGAGGRGAGRQPLGAGRAPARGDPWDRTGRCRRRRDRALLGGGVRTEPGRARVGRSEPDLPGRGRAPSPALS